MTLFSTIFCFRTDELFQPKEKHTKIGVPLDSELDLVLFVSGFLGHWFRWIASF